MQVCTKFVKVIMENNRLHKSVINITLYNVSINGFPLFSQSYFWTSPVCLSVTKFPSTTSIYFSIFANEPGINLNSLMSCDKSHRSLKSNWSVVICFKKILFDFLHWKTYVALKRISYLDRFCLHYFLMSYLFSFICMHKF